LDLTGGYKVIQDSLTPLKTVDYLVNLQPQQNLSVNILGGDVVMEIYDPNGQSLSNSSGPIFSFEAPMAGQYRIRLRTNERMNDVTNYSLGVEVKNIAP
jgi:hypothetical protein